MLFQKKNENFFSFFHRFCLNETNDLNNEISIQIAFKQHHEK